MTGIVSVWSAYGHRFMSTGEDDGAGNDYESCLTCGAEYVLRPLADDPKRGEYTTSAGDEPAECTGDTSMAHGYPGERHCHECDASEPCAHVEHACNCVQCV